MAIRACQILQETLLRLGNRGGLLSGLILRQHVQALKERRPTLFS